MTKPINAHSGAAYRATKGVLGSSRASLLKIANNALYFSMGLTDADAGIPPENKYALVSRVGALPTSKKHRSLTGSVFLLEREPEVRPRAPARPAATRSARRGCGSSPRFRAPTGLRSSGAAAAATRR